MSLVGQTWAVETPLEPTAVGSNRVGDSDSPGSIIKELSVDTFSLPEYLGHIKDSWSAGFTPRRGLPSDSSLARGESLPPVVIHIQDAHCNYAAQKKLSEIIEYLNKEYGIDTINLEGGAKDYDLSVFTDMPDKAIREKTADYFVKEGLVNGAEYFAISNPEKATLWGVEDTKLYIDNLNVYRDSLKYKDEVDKHLKSLSHILSNLKTKIYSQELLDLDIKYSQYKAGNLEFKDYLSFLIQSAKNKAIDIKGFTNIYLLSQTLAEEGNIDFKKADNQRDDLIDKLQKKLSKKSLEELVIKTVEFRSEKISQKEFYTYLIKKTDLVSIELNDFPDLQRYIVYISMYSAIDKMKVMEEMDKLENAVKESFYQNDKQRDLSRLSKNLAILKNIFNISLTREDYRYYLDNEQSFNISNYSAFINKEAPPYKITARLDGNISDLDRYRENISKFYEYSFKRDAVFLKNIKFVVSSLRVPPKAGRSNPKNAAILITGGFHTENLCEIFKKQNISYVSIMPNFKNGNGYECPYFNLLAGELPGLYKKLSLAISSHPASLMQIPAMLSALGDKVWGRANIDSFKASVVLQDMVLENGWAIDDITVKDGVLYHTADGKTGQLPLVELLYKTHERFIDKALEEHEDKFVEIVGTERDEARRLALEITSNENIRKQIEDLFDNKHLQTHPLLLQGEHVGGYGVTRVSTLNGKEALRADLHGIIAGFVKDHKLVDPIVDALIAEQYSVAKGLFAKIDIAKKHTDKNGQVTALWEMSEEERKLAERDFAMLGLGLHLEMKPTLKQLLELRLEELLEQRLKMRLKMRLEMYLEHFSATMEKIVPEVWENARKDGRIRRYRKHGFDFEYAVVNKTDYKGHLSPFDLMSDNEEGTCGFAHYSESTGQYYLMVDGDFFKKHGNEEFIEYVAIHERGHELSPERASFDSHFYATKLEFAIVAKEGKIRPYLAWIEKNWPGKLGDVYSVIEGGDSIPRDSDKFKEYMSDLKQSNDYALAHGIVENSLELPAEAMEKIYVFEKINQQAEEALEDAIIRIADAAENVVLSENMNFAGFLAMLNAIMKEALDKIIDGGYSDRLYLRRVKLACREYLKKHLDVKIEKIWQNYLKANEGQESSVYGEISGKLEFIENVSFSVNKIMDYLKARRNHSAKEVPTAREMLFMDTVIEHQKAYLESGRKEDLRHTTPDDVAAEIGLTATTVRGFIRKIKTITYKGKDYPLELLVPSSRIARDRQQSPPAMRDSHGMSGLGNDEYTEPVKKAIDEGEFSAVTVTNGVVTAQQSLPDAMKSGNVMLQADQLVVLNDALKALTPEEIGLLRDSIILFIPDLDDAVYKGLAPPNCYGTHYGIQRDQYYFDTACLKDAEDLARQLHHEIQERKAVISETTADERATPIDQRSPDVAERINKLASAAHDRLIAEAAPGAAVKELNIEGMENIERNAEILKEALSRFKKMRGGDVIRRTWVLPMLAMIELVTKMNFHNGVTTINSQIIDVVNRAHFAGASGYIFGMKTCGLIVLYFAGAKEKAEKELEVLKKEIDRQTGVLDMLDSRIVLAIAYYCMNQKEKLEELLNEIRNDRYFGSEWAERARKEVELLAEAMRVKGGNNVDRTVAVKLLSDYINIGKDYISEEYINTANFITEQTKDILTIEPSSIRNNIEFLLKNYSAKNEKHRKYIQSLALFMSIDDLGKIVDNTELFIDSIWMWVESWGYLPAEIIEAMVKKLVDKNIPIERRIKIIQLLSMGVLFESGNENSISSIIAAFENEVKEMRLGIKPFDKDSMYDQFIGYISILSLPEAKNKIANEKFTYNLWLDILRTNRVIDTDNLEKGDIIRIGEHSFGGEKYAEVNYLCYEAHAVLKEVILPAIDRAKEFKVPLVLVPNLSYGGMAIAPIMKMLEEIRDDAERAPPIDGYKFELKIIFTKQGSSEAHGNPNVLNKRLFSEEETAYFRHNNPIVLVFDGTTSVDHDGHYPDATQGYVNFWKKIMGRAYSDSIQFVTMTSKRLYRRLGEAPIKQDSAIINKLSQPSLINVQVAMTHNDISQRAMDGDRFAAICLSSNSRHRGAFFDDSDVLKTTSLLITDRGPVLNNAFNRLALTYYEKLLAQAKDVSHNLTKPGGYAKVPGPATGESGNVTCGTICESGHQEILDLQLETYYKGLAKEARIDKDILNGEDVLSALDSTGKLKDLGATKEQLQAMIEYIRRKGDIPDGIDILFAIPPDNEKLWWIEGSKEEGVFYAGGHFNKAGTRIHISLPLILSLRNPEECALTIIAHEYRHISAIQRGAPDEGHEYDRGMMIVENVYFEHRMPEIIYKRLQDFIHQYISKHGLKADKTPQPQPYYSLSAAYALRGEYDVGIGIAKGGVSSTAVFEFMGLPTYLAEVHTRNGANIFEWLDKIKNKEEAFHGKRIIIFDNDLITGKTLKKLLARLRRYGPKSIDVIFDIKGYTQEKNINKKMGIRNIRYHADFAKGNGLPAGAIEFARKRLIELSESGGQVRAGLPAAASEPDSMIKTKPSTLLPDESSLAQMDITQDIEQYSKWQQEGVKIEIRAGNQLDSKVYVGKIHISEEDFKYPFVAQADLSTTVLPAAAPGAAKEAVEPRQVGDDKIKAFASEIASHLNEEPLALIDNTRTMLMPRLNAISKEGQVAFIQSLLIQIDNTLTGAERTNAHLAIRAVLGAEAVSEIEPGAFDVVTQIVPLEIKSKIPGEINEANRALREKSYGVNAKSIEVPCRDSTDLESQIDGVIERMLSAMKDKPNAMGLMYVPLYLLTDTGKSKLQSITQANPNIKVQITEEEKDEYPDVMTLFELGVKLLDWDRSKAKGIAPSQALLNLLAAIAASDQNPIDILNNLFNFGHTLRIRKIDLRTIEQAAEAMQLVRQAL